MSADVDTRRHGVSRRELKLLCHASACRGHRNPLNGFQTNHSGRVRSLVVSCALFTCISCQSLVRRGM